MINLLKKIDGNTRNLLIAFSIIVLLFAAARSLFWIIVFIAIASISEIYNTSVKSPIHFDLVKLATILTSIAYGAWWGIFVGLTSSFLSKLLSERLTGNVFISFAGIILIAFLAEKFSNVYITTLGMGLVLLYYAVTSPINIAFGTDLGYALVYVGSSIFINYFLFTSVAPVLINFL